MLASERLKIIARIVLGVEIAFTIAIGAYLRWGLQKNDLASAAWIGGVLAATTTLFLSLKIETTLSREFEAIRKVLGLVDAYLGSEHVSLSELKVRKLQQFVECLEGYRKGEATLEGEEYYVWLEQNGAKGYRKIEAVSLRPESVYTDDVKEQNWLAQNVDRAKSSTKIERIFVSSPDRLVRQKNRDPILVHLTTDNMAAFVVWLNSLSPEILTEIGGGGFSVYDDKVAFWDQSYFRRALVGLKPGNAAMDLMPVASIYCNPHSKVAKFKNVYQALRSYVPSNLRNSPKAAYLAILKSVDEYLGEEHGTLEELSARVNHDSDEFEIVEEWRDLREEIRKLQDSFHPTV